MIAKRKRKSREIDCAEKISLPPYHEGGKSRCEQLGRSYAFTGAAAPDDKHIDFLKQIVESLSIKISIGS